METQPTVMLVIGLVLLIVFMFLPQWQARRRRKKQMAEMRVGDEVMTVGGIIGKLTYFNAEENRARVEIAPGVKIQIVVSGISRPMRET